MGRVLVLLLACAGVAPPEPDAAPPFAAPAAAPVEGPSVEAMEAAVRHARARAPEGATIVVEPPFVVVGTEPRATVEARAEGTVRRVVELLRQDYFEAQLGEPWEIWLFGDAPTYERETERIFGQPPSTPYGFADGNFRALVMNISTGGGTLVHELVHPYLRADFPEAAPWFNEGLASLYEQVGEDDGHLVGYPNWRLPTLQAAIRANQLPDFSDLMALSEARFYGDDRGLNYAYARYVCYWLQEQGLLRAFYRRYRENPQAGGYTAFREVLGEPDMDYVRREWMEFVLSIPHP